MKQIMKIKSTQGIDNYVSWLIYSELPDCVHKNSTYLFLKVEHSLKFDNAKNTVQTKIAS